jgi:hypothetical protein
MHPILEEPPIPNFPVSKGHFTIWKRCSTGIALVEG